MLQLPGQVGQAAQHVPAGIDLVITPDSGRVAFILLRERRASTQLDYREAAETV